MIVKILQLFDRYDPYLNDIGWVGTLNTTGPIIYTTAIESIIKTIPPTCFRKAEVASEWGIKYSIYETPSYSSKKDGHSLFHLKDMKKNYRNSIRPIIPHPNRLMSNIHVAYLTSRAKIRSWIPIPKKK